MQLRWASRFYSLRKKGLGRGAWYAHSFAVSSIAVREGIFCAGTRKAFLYIVGSNYFNRGGLHGQPHIEHICTISLL